MKQEITVAYVFVMENSPLELNCNSHLSELFYSNKILTLYCSLIFV